MWLMGGSWKACLELASVSRVKAAFGSISFCVKSERFFLTLGARISGLTVLKNSTMMP